MKILEYLRCPVCGKLSRARNYNSSIVHNIEIKINEIGGNKHIVWYSKEVPRDILHFLYLRIKSVCNRLEMELGIDVSDNPSIAPMVIEPSYIPSQCVNDVSLNDITIMPKKVNLYD